MELTWDARVDQFWDEFDHEQPQRQRQLMQSLLRDRPEGDAAALYEWASVHDSLGMEQQAIPLYREALTAGLDDVRRPQAVIQLASSLRNVGELEEAAAMLRDAMTWSDAVVGEAASAFLALVLRDQGKVDEALTLALTTLAKTLPRYQRAVTAYAQEPRPRQG